jgi:NitT/TauT family transport system substrate-binding protein
VPGWSKLVFAAAALGFGLVPLAGRAQEPMSIVLALPTATLTFTAPVIAEDAGFYKKEGLKVTQPILVGVASVNAVIAGSADFTIGTGPVFLRAAAQGQRLLAVANIVDKPMVEMVLRKDVYDRLKITPDMSLAERAKLLKGTTIAIQGVGSIVHAWERFVAVKGGLDPENDVRIAPMDPPAMLAALQTKQVDGFTTSMPYTTQAIMGGNAVMFALGDAPELLPFAYGLVYAKPETCKANADKCRRLIRALAGANQMIHDKPDEALNILRARFKEIDPPLLEGAWKVVVPGISTDLHVSVQSLANSEKVNLEAKLLDPKDKLSSYDGLYTDEYLPR